MEVDCRNFDLDSLLCLLLQYRSMGSSYLLHLPCTVTTLSAAVSVFQTLDLLAEVSAVLA